MTARPLAVTGATGFIGLSLVARARERGRAVRALVRATVAAQTGTGGGRERAPLEVEVAGDLGDGPLDPRLLRGAGAVVHLAGRAHRGGEGEAAEPLYRATNVEGTRHLIEAMRGAGVRRIVYLSSIHAAGVRSRPASPLRPDQEPRPEDAYGRTKLAAEALLLEARDRDGLEPVILRPPLVHGPGARGNLARLLKAVARGRWLPLGLARNRRSLVGLDNLVDAILVAVDHPGVVGRTYHLADDGTLSVRRLVEVLAEGMGRRARLLPVPPWLARGALGAAGQGGLARRLFEDLEVDGGAFRSATGWVPPVGLEEGLRRMAAAYLAGAGR